MMGRMRITAGQVALGVSFVVFALVLGWQAVTLPDAVPGHIGYDGEVTRWGTRTQHIVMMAVVGTLMLLSFVALPLGLRRLPPDMMNIPHKKYWKQPENWPGAQRLIADDMGWLGAIMMAFITYASWGIGRVAQDHPRPAWEFAVATGLVLGGVIGYTIWMYAGSRWRPS